MAKAYRRYTTIRYIIDAPIVGISYLVAANISSGQSIGYSNETNYLFTIIALVVWYITTSFSKLYADRRSNKYSEEIIFIVYTIILFTILLSSVSFFLRNFFQFGPNFFPLFIGILFFFLTLTKYIIRKYLHSAIFQGKLYDNVLIIGATPSALDFYETINKYYYYGYKCVGFLDNHNPKMNGCAYQGKLNNLPNILKEKRIDEVVIALPGNENQQIQQCIEVCDYYATKTRILPNLHQYASSIIQLSLIHI